MEENKKEENIRIDLKKSVNVINWIALDRDHWRALINVILNLQIIKPFIVLVVSYFMLLWW